MDELEVNVRSTARTPMYEGTTSGDWSAPTLTDCISGYNSNENADVDADMDWEDLPSEARSWISSLSLLGAADADDFRNGLFFPVVEPSSLNLSENALDAVISGRGSQADISAEALSSAQTRARTLLNEEFDRDLEVNNVNMKINVEAPEGVDEKTFVKQIQSGFAQLFNFVSNKKECCMEKIDAILDSDLVAFSREELEDMTEEKIDSLHDLVTHKLEADQREEDQEERPEAQEEDITDEEPEGDAELSPELVKVLDAEFKDFGGLAGVKETMSELQANKKSKHASLVNKLVANERCPIEKDRLETMNIEVLEDLDRTFAPADYGGQGGNGLQSQSKGEKLEVYSAPAIVEKE
jgi:hypothetical protein